MYLPSLIQWHLLACSRRFLVIIENKNKAGWKKDFQSRLNYLVAFLFFHSLPFSHQLSPLQFFEKLDKSLALRQRKLYRARRSRHEVANLRLRL